MGVAAIVEDAFRAGMLVGEDALDHHAPQENPYEVESVEALWWSRGYAYMHRLLRATTAEKKIAELEKKVVELTARAIVAEQHKVMERLAKGSATEQLEASLREKLAYAEIRAESAERMVKELSQSLTELEKFLGNRKDTGVE